MENNLLLKTKKNEYGLYESALACLVFVLFNIAFTFIYGSIYKSISFSGLSYIAQFLIEFLFFLAALVVAKTRRIDFEKATGLNKKINGQIVFYGFLIAVVSMLGFSNLTNVFLQFLANLGYTSVLGSLEIPNFGIYLVYVFVICITPAVCEEVLFRGVILSGFKKYGARIAIILSSLIFTFMHGNAEQTVHQFIVGIIVGYLFFKSGNVLLGIIVHFFNNFISITLSYAFADTAAAGEAAETASNFVSWGVLFLNLALALIYAYIGYVVIKYLFNKILKEDAILNKTKDAEALETTTIKVDDTSVNVEMTIDGETITEKDTDTNTSGTENAKEKSEVIPLGVIVMFALSGLYLAFEWLSTLLIGFGIG